MNIKFLFTTILSLALTACAPFEVYYEDVMAGGQPAPPGPKVNSLSEPKNQPAKATLGTIKSNVTEALNIIHSDDRAILTGIGSDGTLSIYGTGESKFKIAKQRTKGTPIKTITINVYKNSPLCFEVPFGDGTAAWLPASPDCPGQH